MDNGLHCSPQMNVLKDPENKPVKVPTVAIILTLENELSFPVVYRLQFKAPRAPDSQPSTGGPSKGLKGKHSIDPREDETGFLPSKESRSVRVVRHGGGKKLNVPNGSDGSLEVLWCIPTAYNGDDMTQERRKQILNEERSKGNLKIIRISIDAIGSSATPRSTASLQPSQSKALYVEPPHWTSGEWISFTLTDIDGEQHPAQFAFVESKSTGGGGYAEVWKCNIAVQGAEPPSSFVAVKSLRRLNCEPLPPKGKTIEMPRALKELEIWRGLRHQYIAPLLGNFNSATPCFITIWYECGTLFDCISQERLDRDRIRILKELAEGLQYLHSNDVIHGDIHNGNVLARKDEAGSIHPVFIDFGLSKLLEDSYNQTVITSSIRQKGRTIYMAPELLGYSSPPRHKPSDVYAFALLLLEVASGRTAFTRAQENTPKQTLLPSIVAGFLKPDQSRFLFINTAFWDFLSECWAAKFRSRPSIHDIIGRLGAMNSTRDCYQQVM